MREVIHFILYFYRAVPVIPFPRLSASGLVLLQGIPGALCFELSKPDKITFKKIPRLESLKGITG
jgi:hypothetical protein